jgi:predicted restriction endonuclease
VPIKIIRRDAVQEVAGRRSVDPKTVADKFIRWLNPPVRGTSDFDRLLLDWLTRNSSDLQTILTGYGKSSRDRTLVANFFSFPEAPPTRKAADIDEPVETARVRQEVYRILRDTARAREIKAAHQYRCQICNNRLTLSDGSHYAEAHHVQPLGRPHNGPDIGENIICVCPNCHVLLDYGSKKLDRAQLEDIDQIYIDYHNARICRP